MLSSRNARHNLTPADRSDIAAALAFALRFAGRKRAHNADEIMAEIVAKRLLARAGFVVMKRPPIGGGAALGRGFDGRRPRVAIPNPVLCWGANRSDCPGSVFAL